MLDHRGRLRHSGGVVSWPGLYVLGLPVLRRRRSSLIDGAAGDSAALADHLAGVSRRLEQLSREDGFMNTDARATVIASAVADRELELLGKHFTDDVRLRCLLPGRPDRGARPARRAGEVRRLVRRLPHGRARRRGRRGGGHRLLVHYRLSFDPDGDHRVLTQTWVRASTTTG